MFVLNTSSPMTFLRAPKSDPRMAVPSSRTRLPSIRWTLTRFPVRLLGFVSRGERSRLSRRQPQVVQPRHHLVPMAALPVHAATRRTPPELPVARRDALRHEALHISR